MIEALELIQSNLPWLLPFLAFVFGAIVGSFLNVCIYRIPAGQSVVMPGSTCACGQRIAFYHNIPVLSWILLRGRAACCEVSFSYRYPLVECLTGLLFAVCWIQLAPVPALLGMFFVSILICATFIDLDHMIIPDRFSIGGMVAGVLLAVAFPSLHAVEATVPVLARLESGLTAITGVLVGSGLVYWISVLGEVVFRKPAMGEGDVKFVGCIGAFCGWQGAVFSMFGGALIGTLFLLPWLAIERLRRHFADDSVDDDGFAGQVPFGPMLAAAGVLYYLGCSQFVDAYFSGVADLLAGALQDY